MGVHITDWSIAMSGVHGCTHRLVHCEVRWAWVYTSDWSIVKLGGHRCTHQTGPLWDQVDMGVHITNWSIVMSGVQGCTHHRLVHCEVRGRWVYTSQTGPLWGQVDMGVHITDWFIVMSCVYTSWQFTIYNWQWAKLSFSIVLIIITDFFIPVIMSMTKMYKIKPSFS